jgi:hypothetical protein
MWMSCAPSVLSAVNPFWAEGVVTVAANHGGDVGSKSGSENVIEASWDALVDSLEFGVQPLSTRTPSTTSIRSSGD